MENTECLVLAGWLAGWDRTSDSWGLKALHPKPGLTATCYIVCAELSPPPPVQALTLKDQCPEQNIQLLPNNSL